MANSKKQTATMGSERIVLPIPEGGEVMISLMDLGHKLKPVAEVKQEVKIVPWRLMPAQLIANWKRDHQKEINERQE